MFAFYPFLLMFSGVLLVVLAVLPWQTGRRRIISAFFAAVFLGYGCYLEFAFTGGTYVIFYYAFIVPVVLAVQSVRAYRFSEARKAAEVQQAHERYQALLNRRSG
jgi:hypothetical protein